MTIADVFFVHQRGLMNSIYIWVANVGSNLAIVAAGFITVDQGWRWVWWWFTIFFGLQLIMFVLFFQETKFAHIETLGGRQGSVSEPQHTQPGLTVDGKDKKQAISGQTSPAIEAASGTERVRKLSTIQMNPAIPRKTYRQRLSLLTISPGPWSHFLRHSYQPFMILFTIPGVLFCSLCYAVLLAWSTVMTAALSIYMIDAPYNFSASDIGLMSLAPFVGNTLGSLVCGPVSDRVALYLSKRNGGIYEVRTNG